MKKQKPPLCPKCGSEKIHFSDTNELECQCGYLFEPPEHMRGKGTPRSKQEPQGVVSEEVLQRARVGDPPRIPRFKDLESVKDHYWKAKKKELKKLEGEVKIIRKEREPIHAKVAELEGMHPFEELENYTVNARTRMPDSEGLPKRLIAASFSEKSYKKLKTKLAELDKQIEDKEVEISAIRSLGILQGHIKVEADLPATAAPPWLTFLRCKGTFTMKETARIIGVHERTVKDTLMEPNGPLKYAPDLTRVLGTSIAKYLGVSLEE